MDVTTISDYYKDPAVYTHQYPTIHTKPIVVGNTRIMTVTDYETLIRNIKTPYHRLLFNAMFFTGMRHVELERFIEAKLEWYDRERRGIHVPDEAVKKAKVHCKHRFIPLSDKGMEIMDALVKARDIPGEPPLYMPQRASWGQTLKLAALRSGLSLPETITPKCTRKTWESWLLLTFPTSEITIVRAMGHTANVAIRNYIGLGFSRPEKYEIDRYTRGFIQSEDVRVP